MSTHGTEETQITLHLSRNLLVFPQLHMFRKNSYLRMTKALLNVCTVHPIGSFPNEISEIYGEMAAKSTTICPVCERQLAESIKEIYREKVKNQNAHRSQCTC